jgi:hypothetical protein
MSRGKFGLLDSVHGRTVQINHAIHKDRGTVRGVDSHPIRHREIGVDKPVHSLVCGLRHSHLIQNVKREVDEVGDVFGALHTLKYRGV